MQILFDSKTCLFVKTLLLSKIKDFSKIKKNHLKVPGTCFVTYIIFIVIQVRELHVPCTPGFTFAEFLSKPTQTREWNIQGLPSDAFSTENGVIVNRGNRLATFKIGLILVNLFLEI